MFLPLIQLPALIKHTPADRPPRFNVIADDGYTYNLGDVQNMSCLAQIPLANPPRECKTVYHRGSTVLKIVIPSGAEESLM